MSLTFWKKTLVLIGFITIVAVLYDAITMARYRGDSTEHFNGSRFVSPGTVYKSFRDVLKWSLNREMGPWEHRPVETSIPLARVDGDQLTVTFINHSTVLVQVGGLNILTDPIWSKAAGPLGRIGPSRFRDPGVAFDQLPPIDAVLVSHSHYDHMALPTLKQLHQRDQPVFVAGLGNDANFAAGGIDTISTLAWWQRLVLSDRVEIVATPAAHWSRRTLLDTNRAHWTSYMIMVDGKPQVFFAGDTGYGAHFKEIYGTLGPPHVALLPIGAYLPRWFMAGSHISPEEALQSAQDLRALVMVPIHFGTYALADDGQDEPLVDLHRARPQHIGFELVVLDNGQHASFTMRP